MTSDLDRQKAYAAAQSSLSDAFKQMHSLNEVIQSSHYNPAQEEICEQETNLLKWKVKHAFQSFCILLEILGLHHILGHEPIKGIPKQTQI